MILRNVYLETSSSVVPLVVSQVNVVPKHRAVAVDALRNRTQRRRVVRGGGVENVNLQILPSKESLIAAFSLFCNQTTVVYNNVQRTAYVLTNSSVLPSSQFFRLVFVLNQGAILRTQLGVVSELRFSVSSTNAPSLELSSLHFCCTTAHSGNYNQFAFNMLDFQGARVYFTYVQSGTSQTFEVAPVEFVFTYQRELEPKASVRGQLETVFQSAQTSEIELTFHRARYDTLRSLLLSNQRVRIDIVFPSGLVFIFPSVYLNELSEPFSGLTVRLNGICEGTEFSQVQLVVL